MSQSEKYYFRIKQTFKAMKKILGLDLGTTSIGWAIISQNNGDATCIDATGIRSIPTDAATLSDYGRGNTVSQTKERTNLRSARRLRERHLLRRQRLFRVLNKMGYLPQHFSGHIDNYGHFVDESEPKIAWSDGRFVFNDSFEEMLSEFKEYNPDMFASDSQKIPYDWTIYYLRKKALHKRISREELAWIILNFNQKRGYYQLRGEDEDSKKDGKIVEYKALKVTSVEATDQTKGNQRWYRVHFENGWICSRASATKLDWEGKTKEFIVTTQLNSDGSPKLKKDGDVKRSFSAPSDDDWALLKIKSEEDIVGSGKSVGEYIYDSLLTNPSQKIKGGLVRVIERKFYKDELNAILNKQSEYHPELSDETLYNEVIEDLYRSNEGYRSSIEGRDMIYLIVENIIFYQRPLKTKRSQIADCKYEYYENSDGEKFRLKAIAKSHPLYQEFRLWKFISHLRIFREDIDVTNQLLSNDEEYTALFDWMNSLREIDNSAFVKYKGFNIPKSDIKLYRWNYVAEDKKKYPCNETQWMINNRLAKKSLAAIAPNELTNLWHILYSVTDREEIKKALTKFATKHNYDCELFVEALKGCIFERAYGAYSQKAIKKFLSLMRKGKYWCEDNIDSRTRHRIESIIDGEVDDMIDDRTRQKCFKIVKTNNISDFKGVDEWLASYLIYGRHSEGDDVQIWRTPKDIEAFLKSFKQHSLCNPIVEKVVTETLRVVKDLWQCYGRFDEIHIELAREMKQTQEQRKRDTKRVADNENTNYRIRKLLEEFQNPEYGVDEVRAFSPSHQDIFKIYEEFAFAQDNLPEDIVSIHSRLSEKETKKQPSKSEITRYKLWLEQQYRSPYTGDIIPLGKLFTTAYEIEHVIPRSLYYNNSLSNKVICESEVNKLKGNRLGLQFIKDDGGARVSLNGGGYVTLFDETQYLDHIKKYYANNKRKAKNLKTEEVPEEFTNSQLNNTRYITKFISSLLSNIVREEGEIEPLSKNIIITSGGVTDALKHDWGLSDVWNRIVAPRFERLNAITSSNQFGEWVCEDGKRFFRIRMPLELSKGFNKKRIDHRHHAMDALVIACTTEAHINYLNNLSSDSGNKLTRFQLRSNLCYKHRPDSSGNYQWRFHKPWDSFTQDAYAFLNNTIVSFKQNLRVINKATNHYERFVDGERVRCKQEGQNWAIRKSLHTAMPYGRHKYQFAILKIHENIGKREYIIDDYIRSKVEEVFTIEGTIRRAQTKIKEKPILDSNNNIVVETAFKVETTKFRRRQPIAKLATRGSMGFKDSKQLINFINKVVDFKIREDLLQHLSECDYDIDKAFSIEGIKNFNSKRAVSINKLPIAESGDKRFPLGEKRSNSHKWMEADSDTNLFYAIYEDEDGKRTFDTVPLNIAIDNQKDGAPAAPTTKKGIPLKYVLSPNDLVYLPTPDQIGVPLSVDDIDLSRVYKMVSCTDGECHFTPANIAYRILQLGEYQLDKKVSELGANNKAQKAWLSTGWSDEMIKSICIPIKVDRIGRIIKVG